MGDAMFVDNFSSIVDGGLFCKAKWCDDRPW
jgi:hypothetical protein